MKSFPISKRKPYWLKGRLPSGPFVRSSYHAKESFQRIKPSA